MSVSAPKCPGCGTPLRTPGVAGSRGRLTCPGCGKTLRYTVLAPGAAPEQTEVFAPPSPPAPPPARYPRKSRAPLVLAGVAAGVLLLASGGTGVAALWLWGRQPAAGARVPPADVVAAIAAHPFWDEPLTADRVNVLLDLVTDKDRATDLHVRSDGRVWPSDITRAVMAGVRVVRLRPAYSASRAEAAAAFKDALDRASAYERSRAKERENE